VFVSAVQMHVVSDAYDIAANYLAKTGVISDRFEIHKPLLDAIVQDFRAGNTNKLRPANRAIARFERDNEVTESGVELTRIALFFRYQLS
jgi:hypothetical protein